MKGNEGFSSARNAEATWPSRWLTPTKGMFRARARALAMDSPTSREPTRPGPRVAAIPPIDSSVTPAFSRASRMTGTMTSTCFREAISGTTPPYFSWMRICEAMTFESSFCPS
jgi:hypothetical protein